MVSYACTYVHKLGGDFISKGYIIGVAAAVVLTATLVITGVLVGSNLSAGSGTAASVGVSGNVSGGLVDGAGAGVPVVSSVNAPNTLKEAVPVASAQTIAIPGFEKMVMKAGRVRQTVKLYNPETNACYFMISLNLADGTPLYRSGMIKPGQVVDVIEISRALQAGTYQNAVLQYECYSSDGLQQLNGAQSVFNLEVVP